MEPNALMGLFGAGASMASGNPVGAALSLGGVALSIFGGMEKAETSKKQAELSAQMSQTEMKQDNVRREAMRLSSRRQQMEVLRNQQRARSLALNNATSQGAQLGSGLQGGFGQVAGQTNWNLSGIRQNQGFGENMFDLNNVLSGQKQQMAQLGGQAATAQGTASLGGSLIQASGPASNLAKQFWGSSSSSSGGGGGEDNKWT